MPRWVCSSLWLSGPFILLIERSPADFWLSILALMFLVRAVVARLGGFENFGLRLHFFFGLYVLSATSSAMPSYSMGETVAWFGFHSLLWQLPLAGA